MFNETEFAEKVVDHGYNVVAEAYTPESSLYPRFCTVISDHSVLSHPHKGHKFVPDAGGAEPRRRKPGQVIEHSRNLPGYPRQMAVFRMTSEHIVTDEDAAAIAMNPRNLTGSAFDAWLRDFTRVSQEKKDRIVAAYLTSGAKTAGGATFDGEPLYDQSYVGNDDPYPLLGYDGKCLFATDHPLKYATGTKSNHAAATALSDTALSAAYTAMTATNAVSEHGHRITNPAETLMVPAALRRTALTLLDSEGLPSSANNDTNTNRSLLTPIINPFLDEFDSDGWFVLGSRRSLAVFDSGSPAIEAYRDPSRKVGVISAEITFGIAHFDWRDLYAGNLATS